MRELGSKPKPAAYTAAALCQCAAPTIPKFTCHLLRPPQPVVLLPVLLDKGADPPAIRSPAAFVLEKINRGIATATRSLTAPPCRLHFSLPEAVTPRDCFCKPTHCTPRPPFPVPVFCFAFTPQHLLRPSLPAAVPLSAPASPHFTNVTRSPPLSVLFFRFRPSIPAAAPLTALAGLHSAPAARPPGRAAHHAQRSTAASGSMGSSSG